MSKTSDPTCGICGKPLSDPVSIERGIGPECYMSRKTKCRKEKSGNLFANRSSYTWGIDGAILWLKDEDGGRSLTNDLENALAEIQGQIDQPLDAFKITYRDSDDGWDGVRLTRFNLKAVLVDAEWLKCGHAPHYYAQGLDIDFFYIGATTYEAAKLRLLSHT